MTRPLCITVTRPDPQWQLMNEPSPEPSPSTFNLPDRRSEMEGQYNKPG
jgi:hypothetical protein